MLKKRGYYYSVYCLQNGIDIQIDDTPGYGASFSTPFCCYNPENRTCEVGGKVIDFNASPEQSLREVEEFLSRKH